MSTEQLIAVLGLAVGGVVGLVGPFIAARSAGRRQTEQLRDERERLGMTLIADRQRASIEERRKLLDQGALLIIDVDEAMTRLVGRAPTQDDSGAHDAASTEWEEILARLVRFRARLTLWFDEGSEVIQAFSEVLREVAEQRSTVAGRIRADDRLLEQLVGSDDPSL